MTVLFSQAMSVRFAARVPNGYFYRTGDIYVILIHLQQISHLQRELETPKQLLL